MKIQNNILKKQGDSKINIPNKLKVTIGSENLNNLTNNSCTQNTNKTLLKKKKNSQSTIENKNKLFPTEPSTSREINTQQIKITKKCNTGLGSTEKDYKLKQSKQKSSKPNPLKFNISQTSEQTKPFEKSTFEISEENKKESNKPAYIADQLSNLNINVQQNNPESKTIMDEIQTDDVNQNQSCVITLLKSPPKLSLRLETFLSKDLIKKSLEVCVIRYVNFSFTSYLSRSIIIKLTYFVFRF